MELAAGQLIEFPKKISCENCQHVAYGNDLYCTLFNEVVYFDDIALDCNEYEPK